MEALQLWVGRDRDFDLSRITFEDPNVETANRLRSRPMPQPWYAPPRARAGL